MSYDLHTHSTCSDGSYSPEKLIALAKEKGLKGLSIADHDSFLAYPEALILGKKYGVEIITGVEFSCHHHNESVHVLGYSFRYSDPKLLALTARHQERRASRNRKMVEKLTQNGFDITEEELLKSASGIIGRPHIALLLMQKGYVSSIAEAFQKYLGDGKKCYVPGERFSVEETIDLIHQAGGLAVLAHPHLYSTAAIAKEILKQPFDGVEAIYGTMAQNKNALWIAYAEKNNLLITAGSDFHGTVKPTPLGASSLNPDQIKPLLDRFYSHYPEYRP